MLRVKPGESSGKRNTAAGLKRGMCMTKATEIALVIAGLVLTGGYFLLCRDSRLAEELSKRKGYDPEELSVLLGAGIAGIGISCIPSLLSVVLQNLWLNVISGILLLVHSAALFLAERRCRKESAEQERRRNET